MKTNAIIRIVVFSLALLVLLGIGAAILSYNLLAFDGKVQVDTTSESYEVMEQLQMEYITRDIRNIEIEWVAGSISVQKDPYISDIEVLEFSPVDSNYQMICKQSGQTLKIQFSEEDFDLISFGVNVDVSKDLVIKIPTGWECNSLEIDTASAEVVISNLSIQEFDFDGASGACQITNCEIGDLDIDTASGNVKFSGTLDTLDCDAASADCTIEVSNIPRSIKMDAMSGDLELILPPSAGFSCTLEAMSSSFDTDFECKNENGTYICGDSACQIKVSVLSGDVSILKGIE